MASPQLPKYQAIYSTLRGQILDGTWPAGARLPAQQELADSFGVTLMTLRQAMAALEADGLVWAARGKGTFVADRPVDIRIGNLSSFSQQMHVSGVDMVSEILDSTVVAAADHADAAKSLDAGGDLARITRRRSVGGLALSLQRSFMAQAVAPTGDELVGDSLYETIESATGWTVAEARESISAVIVDNADAALLEIERGQPALLSIRTSFNQFGKPFLYDEALLVAGRCVLTADRTADRMTLNYGISPPPS